MSTAPFQNVSVPSRASVRRMVEGLDRPVLPMPYHMQPMPTPRRVVRALGVECGGFGEQRLPARPQRVEARGQTGAGFEHLPGGRRVAGAQRIDVAELEPVDAGFLREIVEQRLVCDGGLRHAEAAEGAGRRVVGVDGARIGCARAERDTAPQHAPARGRPPSAPRRRRRRC